MLKRRQISTSTTKNKQAKAIFHFFFFFINQTSLVNIYVENAATLQIRAGGDFFWWCATYSLYGQHSKHEMLPKCYTSAFFGTPDIFPLGTYNV